MPIQQILLGAGGVAAVEVNASNATNVVLASVFGSDWSDSVDKVYNVPNGVTIGATGSNAAILASSGMGGSLVINVSGTVIAVHGSGGGGGAKGIGAQTNNNVRTGDDGGAGGAGGHAININSANITVNNLSGGQISG